MVEFDTRIFGAKLPVNTTLFFVAILTPGFEFVAQIFKTGNSTMRKTLSAKCGKFDLGYV